MKIKTKIHSIFTNLPHELKAKALLFSQEYKEFSKVIVKLANFSLKLLSEQFSPSHLEALAINWLDKLKRQFQEIDIWQKLLFDRLIRHMQKFFNIHHLTEEKKQSLLKQHLDLNAVDSAFFKKYPEIAKDYAKKVVLKNLEKAFAPENLPESHNKPSDLKHVCQFVESFEYAGRMFPKNCTFKLISDVLEKLSDIKKKAVREYEEKLRKNSLFIRNLLLQNFVKDCELALLEKTHKDHLRSYLRNWSSSKINYLKNKTLSILDQDYGSCRSYAPLFGFSLSSYFPS